jgi:rhodanese-related sulfurtransferase
MFLYCASGMRSGLAARTLAGEGYRASNAGTLAEWRAAAWPIVRPKEECGR